MRKLCRFCLQRCYIKHHEIDDVTKDIINVLLLNADLSLSNRPSLCPQCLDIVQQSFSFKSRCFYAEEFIYPFTNVEGLQKELDLKELYLTKQNLKALEIPSNQVICRFCLELVRKKSTTSLKVVAKDVLQKCLPELKLKSIKDPVICTDCASHLNMYSYLIDKCRETEEKINNYRKVNGLNSRGQVGLLSVTEFLCPSSENRDIYQEVLSKLSIDDTSKSDKIYYVDKEVDSAVNPNEKILHKSRVKRIVEYHYSEEEMKIRKYACLSCTYRSNLLAVLKQHQRSVHRSATNPKMFHCKVCTYKTDRKVHLVRHALTHDKEPKKIKLRKCPLCEYLTRYPSTLKKHMVVHTEHSELKTYACKLCSFRTRFDDSVKKHMRLHKKDSYLSCDKCHFQTRYSESLKLHKRRHQKPAEEQFLYCANCDFKTLRKQMLRIHIFRTHMDQSKVEKLRCGKCSFDTFYKNEMQKHARRHKLPNTKIHECISCDYKTLKKTLIDAHEAAHARDGGFKCRECDYIGKHKKQMTLHMLKHKDSAGIQV